ncbi:MAG: hypothetical protein HOD63_05040 [Bacteroidetes bacterium]|jgi:hypothetical protein|nr:hypothetical protein [Bacteroidota bacterium]MBT4729835.1 hypothetical protein [Bacteroidota bacterium]MBT7993874.1 hypothetical protein [Bacteroidota bacterium]
MTRYTSILWTVLILVLTAHVATAQPIPPTPASPLGGGMGILLAAGASYMFIRFIKSKRK